ncbi:MAG: hypothetical protein V4713_09020 [Pseudomonadota bacterium]
MKKQLVLSAVLLASGLAWAQEVGRVISSTPLIQQVSVPRQVCATEQVAVQPPKSGAGAVMGAIAGGAMGNAIGSGGGQAAATMLGLFGGAILGDRIEGAPMAQVQNVQRCGTQTFYESRPVAYNVVYEYAGKQYSVQMPNDPGRTIPLSISPFGAGASMEAPANTTTYAQPMYGQPAQVIVSPPVYSGYYARPYYPPVAIEVDLGYGNGYRGHRHWR